MDEGGWVIRAAVQMRWGAMRGRMRRRKPKAMRGAAGRWGAVAAAAAAEDWYMRGRLLSLPAPLLLDRAVVDAFVEEPGNMPKNRSNKLLPAPACFRVDDTGGDSTAELSAFSSLAIPNVDCEGGIILLLRKYLQKKEQKKTQ